MLVINDAERLVENLPATLPRHVSEVGVFQIEGREQLVESAQLQKFMAIERARSAAAVKAGIGLLDRAVDPMPHTERATFPPALGEARLFAQLSGIAEEDLARDGKYSCVLERFEQRLQETRLGTHVAVEEDHDVVLGRFASGVGAAAEAAIFFESEDTDGRKMPAD